MGNLSEIHVLRELPDTKKTIDEALNIEERNLYDIFEDEDFQVPDYQRNYSWEKTQREDLWTTLKNAFKELEPLPDDLSDLEELTGIYMGAMYFAEPSNNDDNKRLDVVDGQQRLATFQLLLKVSYDYVLYLKGRANDEELYGLADDLRKVEQKLNEAYNDESEPSVQLNEEDKDYFQALAADPDRWYIGLKSFLENRIERDDHVSGQMKPRAITIEEIISQIQSPIKYNGDRDVSSEFSGELGTWIRYEKSHERMMNTYTETYSLIEDIFNELTDDSLEEKSNVIMNFVSYLLYAMSINECLITEPNPELRLDIFQSINDKGLELHDIDKIRARIKHRLVGEESSGTMEEWRSTLERFGGDKDDIQDMLKYFIAATEEKVSDISEANDAIMHVFDRTTPSDVNYTARLTKDDASELVSEVSEYSKYYKDIVDCRLDNTNRPLNDDDIKDLKRIMDRIGNRIGATQWRALAAYIYMDVDKNMQVDEGSDGVEERGQFLLEVFDAIEVVTLRQSISDHSGEAIEGVYTSTVQKFRGRDKDERFDSTQVVSDLVNEVEEKVEDLFEDGLIHHITKRTNWTSGNLTRCLFQRSTEIYLNDGDIEKEIRNYEDIDIEHILPKTPISDESERSEASSDPGKYAWLDYFFKVGEKEIPVAENVQNLKNNNVDTLRNSQVEQEDLEEDDANIDDIHTTQNEISGRFIDDISNLIFLVDTDNEIIQNKMFSKKIPVYWDDYYIDIMVNDFLKNSDESGFFESDITDVERSEIERLSTGTASDTIAQKVDKAWNYDIMFERKEKLIKQLLKYIEFSVKEDEFDGLDDQIRQKVTDDKERRIECRNF